MVLQTIYAILCFRAQALGVRKLITARQSIQTGLDTVPDHLVHSMRQSLSRMLTYTRLFGGVLYFCCSGLSYWLVFDKSTFKHPKFLKNQVKLEIKQALWSLPFMSLLTAPCFWLDVQGYAKLYDHPDDAPFWLYNFIQFPFFLLFTDMLIYFIHRGLHHPLVYKTLHKAHHKWIMPTPFASHAFHPVDGFLQSAPYHLFPFLFPLQKFAYVALFVFVNIWTIFIHDGEYMANSPILNGAACHTMHHLYFNYSRPSLLRLRFDRGLPVYRLWTVHYIVG